MMLEPNVVAQMRTLAGVPAWMQEGATAFLVRWTDVGTSTCPTCQSFHRRGTRAVVERRVIEDVDLRVDTFNSHVVRTMRLVPTGEADDRNLVELEDVFPTQAAAEAERDARNRRQEEEDGVADLEPAAGPVDAVWTDTLPAERAFTRRAICIGEALRARPDVPRTTAETDLLRALDRLAEQTHEERTARERVESRVHDPVVHALVNALGAALPLLRNEVRRAERWKDATVEGSQRLARARRHLRAAQEALGIVEEEPLPILRTRRPALESTEGKDATGILLDEIGALYNVVRLWDTGDDTAPGIVWHDGEAGRTVANCPNPEDARTILRMADALATAWARLDGLRTSIQPLAQILNANDKDETP